SCVVSGGDRSKANAARTEGGSLPCHLRPDIELAPVSARGYPPPCPAQHTSPSTSIHTGTRCSHLLSAVRQGPCFSLSPPHHDICDLCLRDGPLEDVRVRSGALVAQGASRHCHGLILIRRIGRNHLPRASCRTTRACAMLRCMSSRSSRVAIGVIHGAVIFGCESTPADAPPAPSVPDSSVTTAPAEEKGSAAPSDVASPVNTAPLAATAPAGPLEQPA